MMTERHFASQKALFPVFVRGVSRFRSWYCENLFLLLPPGAQCGALADAARCEGACSALHRPSHRSAFYRPAACSPPHGEFRPRPPHADLCRESPTEAVLGTAPCHPKRHPDTRQNPRWFQGNAPQHGREGSPPTPFEHKCMKRRKFPLPLQGETICLGTR